MYVAPEEQGASSQPRMARRELGVCSEGSGSHRRFRAEEGGPDSGLYRLWLHREQTEGDG